MSTINDLKISVSEMSEYDLFEHIKNIRSYRRLPIQKNDKAKKASKKSVNTNTLINGLTNTQREDLIKLLEGR